MSLPGDLGRENEYPEGEQFSTYALLEREFRELGCEVRRFGEIMLVTRDGAKCHLLETETSFTSLVGFRVLKNKELSNRLFRDAGVSVASLHAFTVDEKERARQAVRRLGIAVIKPSDGRKGRGVSVGVTEDSFDNAWQAASGVTQSRILVESFFQDALEARYLVVDGACVAVLMRIPPAIIGNGVRSIKQLLEAKNAIRSRNPHLRSRPIKVDSHRLAILRSQGYDLNSVPQKGQSVLVDLKAGFSTGASSCNITSHVHPLMKGVAERAAGVVGGLDVVGVDILARDHSAAPESRNYIVVEANTRPGIGGHHYPSFGAPINVCRIIAESCVRKMARSLGSAPHTRAAKS